LRVGFSGNYAIYYLHNEHELVIVRVLHGARDAAVVAEHGGSRKTERKDSISAPVSGAIFDGKRSKILKLNGLGSSHPHFKMAILN
jgi:hypothetical protein